MPKNIIDPALAYARNKNTHTLELTDENLPTPVSIELYIPTVIHIMGMTEIAKRTWELAVEANGPDFLTYGEIRVPLVINSWEEAAFVWSCCVDQDTTVEYWYAFQVTYPQAFATISVWLSEQVEALRNKAISSKTDFFPSDQEQVNS